MGKWRRLDKVELLKPLGDKEYEHDLPRLQDRTLHIQLNDIHTGGRAVIAVEGWDAAGKGGFISRMIENLEPRSVFVWRIGAPTQEEKAQHYLWRFWTRLPQAGNWAVFDRTWYGRVLVERVENFCSKQEWKRGYNEINEFERQLTDDGVRVVKLLFHTSEEQQKRRIIDRLGDPRKHYKVGLEDFRNLGRRKDYLEAYDDMLERTDTPHAPWHVIATDDKQRARVEAMKVVTKLLGRDVGNDLPPLDPKVIAAAKKMWGWKPGSPSK
jgi:polyphosphate kinase 2 (PPK2 family)